MPDLTHETSEVIYEKLRVVGIRVDPCFPLMPPATGCQAQVRMVWQPIETDGNGQTRFIDAAVHTFYNLSDLEFSETCLST